MASVGAIVPSFNRAAMLCDCLESLLLQTRPLDEILVVDDGSTDGTADIVSARFGARVRIVRKDNGGKSSALNLGLEQLQTDFVWICDDDDIAAPGACEALAAALERAPDGVGFAHGHYRIFQRDGNGVTLRPPSFWADADEENIHINVLEDLYIFQFATMFHSSALERVGRFREDLFRSQDFEMMVRLTTVFDGVYVPETIFFQCDHAGGRGPALDRAAQADSYKRWLHYDGLFFRDLAHRRRELVPSFARVLPPTLRARAADLQRAVVFGRRGMWDIALAALNRAAARAPDEPASPAEVRLARRLIRHGLPSAALPHRREHLAQFRRLRQGSSYGAALCRAVAGPLTSRLRFALREGRFADACRDALFLLAEGGLGRVVCKLVPRAGPPIALPAAAARPPAMTAQILPAEVAAFLELLGIITENREARQIDAIRLAPTPVVENVFLRSA